MSRCLAITLGDPSGIGPEVALKSIDHNNPVVVIGSAKLLEIPLIQKWTASMSISVLSDADSIDLSTNLRNRISWIDPCPDVAIDITNPPYPGNGISAVESIYTAVRMAMNHQISGIVTAPISKSSFKNVQAPAWDHTGLLGHLTGRQCTMAFYSPAFNVVLNTVHIPLSAVPEAITSDRLTQTIRHAAEWLHQLGIISPKIAVAGLNPHAGEDGLMGREEIDVIRPTIERLQAEIPELSGPYPADTLFWKASAFDCIIAQYHDQGLGPLKTLAFDTAVNTTLGLPFVRTSPDHGTAFDIAYKDIANHSSMTAALQLAQRMTNGN